MRLVVARPLGPASTESFPQIHRVEVAYYFYFVRLRPCRTCLDEGRRI